MTVESTQTKDAVMNTNIEISPLELKVRLDEKENLVLIDVREPNEYEICRIEGSILIPLSELGNRFHELEKFKNKTIVVHCKVGGRSMRAIQFLKQQGFSNLLNLAGGIAEWANQVDPSMPRY